MRTIYTYFIEWQDIDNSTIILNNVPAGTILDIEVDDDSLIFYIEDSAYEEKINRKFIFVWIVNTHKNSQYIKENLNNEVFVKTFTHKNLKYFLYEDISYNYHDIVNSYKEEKSDGNFYYNSFKDDNDPFSEEYDISLDGDFGIPYTLNDNDKKGRKEPAKKTKQDCSLIITEDL
jgi:hypothetical protein